MTAAGATRTDMRAEALLAPLHACARGELAPNVALARLVMVADSRETAEAALGDAARQHAGTAAAQPIAAAMTLWRETPHAWQTIRQVLDAADHGEMAASVEEWAARFDRAARASPEASAALYSLGRPDLLDAAAQEIVRRLDAWGLTGQARSALDLGCGCGRLVAALASRMRRVVGADVSSAMLDAAHLRCGRLGNVLLVQTTGHDLAPFREGAFDLVVAVDVFPYLVDCAGDLAQRHMLEASRLLVPGGSLLILNYSYRRDDDAAVAESTALASRAGLRLVRFASDDFALWDGRTFHFTRPEVS